MEWAKWVVLAFVILLAAKLYVEMLEEGTSISVGECASCWGIAVGILLVLFFAGALPSV